MSVRDYTGFETFAELERKTKKTLIKISEHLGMAWGRRPPTKDVIIRAILEHSGHTQLNLSDSDDDGLGDLGFDYSRRSPTQDIDYHDKA